MPRSSIPELLALFEQYRSARLTLLQQVDRPSSNRDPLAEFSERLVAELLDGHLATSRVQADYDLVGADGRRVQVKYLANRRDAWVNEHHVHFKGEMDAYAVVFFEDLAPMLVVIFPRASISEVCRLLQKRHPGQDASLQLTRRNVLTIQERAQDFGQLGVEVIPLAAP